MHLIPRNIEFQHRWRVEDNIPGGRPLDVKIHAFHCAVSYGSLNLTSTPSVQEVWAALREQLPVKTLYSEEIDNILAHADVIDKILDAQGARAPTLTENAQRNLNQAITYLYAWASGRKEFAPMNRARMSALEYAGSFGTNTGIDKAWILDRMVRALTLCPLDRATGEYGESDEYKKFVEFYGDDEWSTGRDPDAEPPSAPHPVLRALPTGLAECSKQMRAVYHVITYDWERTTVIAERLNKKRPGTERLLEGLELHGFVELKTKDDSGDWLPAKVWRRKP